MQFIKEHFLLFILVISFIFTFLWLNHFRKRLRMRWYAALIASLLHVAYGVFCVKAFAFLESGAASDGFSKMSIFGATFFMPAAYYLASRLTKRKLSDIFDICAICTVFTLGASRINCLHAGCCGGIPFFGTSWCWPTREIEILYYLAFILILAPFILKDKTKGEVYPLYMLTYGALRFLLEFVRVSDSTQLFHLTHLWAALSIAVGLTVLLMQREKRKREKRQGKKKRKQK